MELNFSNKVEIGDRFPIAILHDKDNSIHMIEEREGYFFKRRWNPGLGNVDWENPEFGRKELVYGSSRIVNWKRLSEVNNYGILYFK